MLDLKNAANQNRELFMGSIQMLAGAVDEKDPYTRGHSDRVTRYSMMIAKDLGLSEDAIEVVRVSAQLHDVGKIGIEDRILKKPGALTTEEFSIMKTHTTKGANILRPVAQLKEMIPGIELHHESLDGRGYPHGLKGDEIPLLPRIIAVADTFDALTTNRPYQQAHDPQEALRIIRTLSGKRLGSCRGGCADWDLPARRDQLFSEWPLRSRWFLLRRLRPNPVPERLMFQADAVAVGSELRRSQPLPFLFSSAPHSSVGRGKNAPVPARIPNPPL